MGKLFMLAADGHRFPMPKDHLLHLALQAEGLAQLTFTPTYPDAATLCLVHDEQYVSSFLDGSIPQQDMRKIGLPWSQQLVRRTLIGTGSAILAARLALQYGVACMTNGGTHHAHRSHGSGELGVLRFSLTQWIGGVRVLGFREQARVWSVDCGFWVHNNRV